MAPHDPAAERDPLPPGTWAPPVPGTGHRWTAQPAPLPPAGSARGTEPRPVIEEPVVPHAVGRAAGVAAPAGTLVEPDVDRAAVAAPTRRAGRRGTHRRPGPARRVLTRTAVVVLIALLTAAAAASLAFAVVTRDQSADNRRAADEWRRQAESAQETVDEQSRTLRALQEEAAALRNEVAELTAARDSQTARGDTLQAQLDDATARLAAAEQRVAELAGAQARAADDALLQR